jgi:hypothetical protein
MHCKNQPSVWQIKQPSGDVVYITHLTVLSIIRRELGNPHLQTITQALVCEIWRIHSAVPLYEEQL